jgi:CRP/FNR family cyclic AMP-dependent transcriptional regulator
MASSIAVSQSRAPLEDVLAHLPVSNVVEYRKGQIIYSPERPSKGLYLVAAGKVDLSQVAADGSEVLLDIFRPEELFGESAFHAVPRDSEQAKAHENSGVMTWATSEIEDLVTKRPRLAVALLQILAQRNAELARRVESLAMDTIERRLARSLIRFSERLGTPEEDGSVRMLPLTHGLLSRYVGTSREIISHYMNRFRRQGYVNYSRSGILLYRDALKARIGECGAPAAETTN